MTLQEILSLISGFKCIHWQHFQTGNQTWSVRDDQRISHLVNIFGFRFPFANNIIRMMLGCFQIVSIRQSAQTYSGSLSLQIQVNNQSSAATTLTKNERKIKTYNVFGGVFHYLNVLLPPLLFVTNFRYPLPSNLVTSFLNGP